MKKGILFLMVTLAFCNVSDVVFKIKEIQKSKKNFFKYPVYNIFTEIRTNNSYTPTTLKSSHLSLNPLKIYAIFNKQVNINGEWKKKGDFVNGYKIIKIEPYGVVLKKEDKIKILKFPLKVIKVSK